MTTATTTQPDSGAAPAAPDQPDQPATAPAVAPPADTPRMSGEVAARLLSSSRWLQ